MKLANDTLSGVASLVLGCCSAETIILQGDGIVLTVCKTNNLIRAQTIAVHR